MKYLVSIIIPVYKVEMYIERCLTSVMCQTYQDAPIECVLVDDCSPDNSIVIAKKMVDKYEGNIDFKIIRNDVNCGLSVARNNGLKLATGKYIFFLDSDDYLKENCLQTLLDVLNENSEVEVIMGNFFEVKSNSPFIYFNHNRQVLLNNTQLLKACYQGKIPLIAWNSLVLHKLITDNNLVFEPGLIHEDNLWALQLYSHVNKFVYKPQITMVYENNPRSIMNTVATSAVEELPHFIIILKKLLNTFDEKHFVDYTFFLSSLLFQMLDKSHYCDRKQRLIVRDLRNRLMKHSLCHGRFVIVFFELWMYNPLFQLLRFKLVRHNFHRFKKLVYTLALLFDNLHFNHKNRF